MRQVLRTHIQDAASGTDYTTAVHLLFILIIALFPPHVFAQEANTNLPVTLVRSSNDIEDILLASKGQARQEFEGKGSRATIKYSAATPFDVYVVPFNHDGTYDSFSMLHAMFPAAQEPITVTLDVSESPSWSLRTEKYLFLFVSGQEDANASVYDIAFSGPSIGELIGIVLRHLATGEPYVPASYHTLRGYKILNLPLATVMGIVLVGAVAILLWLKNPKPTTVMAVLAFGMLAYSARIAVDVASMSLTQVTRWNDQHTFGEARGVYTVAERIHADLATASGSSVYVCRDGTNYREKLLRYFAYPVPINDDDRAQDSTHVLVMSKKEWSFSGGTLICGSITSPAQDLLTFPDGTRYFSLTR